ncbi:MAG TPA: hypothetical protein VKY35_04740 [Aliidiomarina sp.]|nr:hypothetical protein [Aliidiomarina sp.]
MQVKLSKDVVPLSELKINLRKVVNRAEELQFVKAVAQGLMDVREGNTVSLADAKKTLAL